MIYILYEMDKRLMIFGRYKVTIQNHRLSARIWGEPIDVGRHQPRVQVKAATYAELAVVKAKILSIISTIVN